MAPLSTSRLVLLQKAISNILDSTTMRDLLLPFVLQHFAWIVMALAATEDLELRSVNGLKQSACQWNKKLHSVLTELGFKRIEFDHSVYVYYNGEVRIIVSIYIDDIILASKSPAAIDKYMFNSSPNTS